MTVPQVCCLHIWVSSNLKIWYNINGDDFFLSFEPKTYCNSNLAHADGGDESIAFAQTVK